MCRQRIFVSAVMIFLCVGPVRGLETHIFFGKHNIALDAEQGKPRYVRLKLGDSFIVAGNHAEHTGVRFSGDEVVLKHANGVSLSKGQGFQIGGGRGMIIIDYPASIGVIEIVYTDTSAIQLSNGCDLNVKNTVDMISMPTLNVQLEGNKLAPFDLETEPYQPVSVK